MDYFHHPREVGYLCESCDFELWTPIATLSTSTLGLYDDSRFRGRCILALHDHYDNLAELPENMAASFMEDIRIASVAIQKASGADRMNLAILGNRDPHIHAHLIPRFPLEEEFPRDSPWKDSRVKEALPQNLKERLVSDIAAHLIRTPIA